MHTVSLTFDESDDVLYFTRANEQDELQQTLTQLAQKYNCSAKEVLEAAVDPETGNSVLHFCAANGLGELLQLILVQLATKQTNGTANGKAADRARSINKQNQQGNTPLHWAAYNGHLEVVKMLVGAGADMWIKNAAGHFAMFEAERAEKSEVVQYLLEVGGRDVERKDGGAQTDAEDDDEEVAATAGAIGSSNDLQEAEGGVEVEMCEG
jgi:uncharacterized protein